MRSSLDFCWTRRRARAVTWAENRARMRAFATRGSASRAAEIRGSVAPMPTVDAATLERLTQDIFVARGVPSEDAAWIATMLVRANLRGHDSHGVIRIPQYVANLKRGTLNPRPKLHLVVDTPTVAVLEGDGGFGQIVARRGIAL